MLQVDNKTLNSWERFKDSDIYFSFVKSPTAIISSIILLIIFFCSFFVEFVTPHNPFDPASLSLMEALYLVQMDKGEICFQQFFMVQEFH